MVLFKKKTKTKSYEKDAFCTNFNSIVCSCSVSVMLYGANVVTRYLGSFFSKSDLDHLRVIRFGSLSKSAGRDLGANVNE